MKNIFRFILLFSFVCFANSLFGQTKEQIDSLFKNYKGEELLRNLHIIQQSHLYQSEDWIFNSLLLKEARKQKNVKYEAVALANQVAYYFRQFENDSIFHYAKIAQKYAQENNCLKDLYLVKQLVVHRYLEQGHYSLALKEALAIYDEGIKLKEPEVQITVLISLATAYRAMNLYEEALKYYRKARSKETQIEDAPYKTLECYAGIAYCYENCNMKDSLFLYTDSMYMEITRLEKEYPVYNLDDWTIGMLLHRAYSLIEQKKQNEAWVNIMRADSIMKKRGEDYPYYIYQSDSKKLRYYHSLGDREKSEEYFDICLKFTQDNQLESEFRNLLRFRAEALSMEGRNKEAVEAYQTLEYHIDSVSRERFIHELNDLKVAYEIDIRDEQIEYQQSKNALKTKYIIALSILAVLLIALCIYIGNNLREIKQKNLSLFQNIKELSDIKKKLYEYNLLTKEKISSHPEDENTSKPMILFKKVEAWMNEKKKYTDGEYGRKDLISDMNTNEVYLARAIREGSGLKITEYINRWRLEYAKQVLLENPEYTIETVASDSGFLSHRNFYRLFREVYGMSPAEFRKQATQYK